MRMIEVWINCPSDETAREISEALLATRLIACANIFPAIESIYRWKGAIEKESEVPLVVKTRKAFFPRIETEVRKLHPHETPSIIAVAVSWVNQDYLDWVYAETGPE